MTGGQNIAGTVTAASMKLKVTDRDGEVVTDSNWSAGDNLQIPLAGHCVAKISDNLALVAGGFNFGFQVTSSTSIYDANEIRPNNPWRTTGSMQTARKHHLCQKVRTYGMYIHLI